MSTEALDELAKMFAEDVAVTSNFDADQLQREHKLNIADNLKAATTPQKHPRKTRISETGEQMAKKEKKPKATGVKKEGKFAFIKTQITAGVSTFDEIVAAAAKQFPDWDAKLVTCGVYSARTQMRKAGLTANWLPDAVATPPADGTAATAKP